MPTTAVNTINRLTLGLVSSKKSCQRTARTTESGVVLGELGTLKGYHARPQRRARRAGWPAGRGGAPRRVGSSRPKGT